MNVSELIFGFNSEPEVSQFELIIFNKDIGHLDISVYDS